MRTYPVVNLGARHPSLGQAPGKTPLEQACDAINYYNMFPDDDIDSQKAKDAAIGAMQGLLSIVAPEDRAYAADKIKNYCHAGQDLFDHIQLPLPQPNPPLENPNPPVATPTPPPKPGTPGMKPTGDPVASIYNPPFMVSSREENPPPYEPPMTDPFAVSSREENPQPPAPDPFAVSSRDENPQPPTPNPFAVSSRAENPQAPPVASVGEGCWYTPGQGYSWGPRQSSGESTGLNKNDCNSLIARDREVRGLPALTQPVPVVNTEAAQTTTPTNATGLAPQASQGNQPPYAPVATGGGASDCVYPNFWDGRQCRGSGGRGSSGLVNQAMNLGPSGGATTPLSPGSLDINPATLTSASFGGMGMGRRFPIVNL